MHEMRRAILALAALLLSCAPPPHSPDAVLIADQASLAHEDTPALCQAYGANAQKFYGATGLARIRDELVRRQALTASDWALVDRRQIGIGMSECGLLASWGQPNQIRRKVTDASEEAQFIYPGRRVLVVGGAIKSFKTVD